jgi:hypothetical protein
MHERLISAQPTLRHTHADNGRVWMKAAVLIGFGGVDQLEVREVPEPKPGPNEVRFAS